MNSCCKQAQQPTRPDSQCISYFFSYIDLYTVYAIFMRNKLSKVMLHVHQVKLFAYGINDYLYRIWTGVQVRNTILEL